MTHYALHLDCSSQTTNGDFQPYTFNSNPPGPTGAVWWQSADDGKTWVPSPSNRPGQDGNPEFVSPLLQNGDPFVVAVRDTTLPANFSIQSVAISVVFFKFRGPPRPNPQSARSSPFQNSSPGDTVRYDQTVFANTIQTPKNGDWCEIQPVTASYPPGHSKKSFEFSVGVVVVYHNASGQPITRQFGIDPEMDVDDCGI